jgi:hypothetical protein
MAGSRREAAIVVPQQNPELAVAEIDRCAADRRFIYSPVGN